MGKVHSSGRETDAPRQAEWIGLLHRSQEGFLSRGSKHASYLLPEPPGREEPSLAAWPFQGTSQRRSDPFCTGGEGFPKRGHES